MDYDQFKVKLRQRSSGPWSIEKFTTGKVGGFTHGGRYIPPGEYTGLFHQKRGCVMSDIPCEINDHLPAIIRLRGRVLIHGLGIGMILKAAITNPRVKHVDVVEIDSDVIRLIGNSYRDPKVTLHLGNAYDVHFAPGERWNVVWHDIWDRITPANLSGMAHLMKRYARRCDWQGAWGFEQCEYMKGLSNG